MPHPAPIFGRSAPAARSLRRGAGAAGIAIVTALGFLTTIAPSANAAAAPSGFVVTRTTTSSISLDWRKVSGASGYRVRYATSPDMTNSKAAAFRYSNGVVTGLNSGTTYYFRVATAKSGGRGAATSPYTRKGGLAGTTRFLAPARASLTSSTGQIAASWSTVSGASSYVVRLSTSPSMSAPVTKVVSGASATFTGLSDQTTYYGTVAVSTGAGSALSDATSAGSATTPGTGPTNPVDFDLQVANWNISGITADSTAAPYPHSPWATRAPIVAGQLLGLKPSDERLPSPDVISLQEANNGITFNTSSGTNTQYSDLIDHLNAQATGGEVYSTVGPTRGTAVKGSPERDSTHIAYNSTDVSVVDTGYIRWDAQETTNDGYRDMQWAIFQIKSTGARFFFASAHLETSSATVRNQQWQQLIHDVPSLAQGLPVIIGGDFNSPRLDTASGQSAPTYLPKMWSAGMGDTLGQGSFNSSTYFGGTPNPFAQSQARAQRLYKGDINSVNVKWNPNLGHEGRSIYVGRSADYIFASNRLAVKMWALVTDNGNDYKIDGILPSDHNLLRSTVVIPAP